MEWAAQEEQDRVFSHALVAFLYFDRAIYLNKEKPLERQRRLGLRKSQTPKAKSSNGTTRKRKQIHVTTNIVNTTSTINETVK